MRRYLLLLLLLLTYPLEAVIDSSIVPVMDYYHSSKHIDCKKYAKTQYKAILDALSIKEGSFRVISYNMLFDRYDHLLAKPYRWNARLPRLIEIIDDMHADIICFQELYPDQLEDLMEKIGNEFGFAGTLTEKSQDAAEINGIFYRKKRFDCQRHQKLYISETPSLASSDPFSNEPRTLIEGHFIDKITKKELAVFCTHAAFGSADSREYAARFIANHLEPLAKEKAVILAGDFNSFPPHVDDPYVPFYDGNYMLKIITSKSLDDAREVSLVGSVGPVSTYTNSEGSILPFQGTGTPGVLLDHIFVGGPILVLITGVQPAQVDGMYASDHMPVIADCIVTK